MTTEQIIHFILGVIGGWLSYNAFLKVYDCMKEQRELSRYETRALSECRSEIMELTRLLKEYSEELRKKRG